MSFFSKIWDKAKDVSKGIWKGLVGTVTGGAIGGGGTKSPAPVQTGNWQQYLPLLGTVVEGLYSGKQAGDLRDWQGQLAGTAHQREVADLRKAGLNPILSGTGGAGAPTPSGAMAQTPDVSGALVARQQLKLLEAQTENIDSQTRKNNRDLELSHLYGDLDRQAQIWRSRLEAQNTASSGKAIEASTAVSTQQARNLLQEAEYRDLSNQELRMRVERMQSDRMFRDYIQSAPYAERVLFDRIVEGQGSKGDYIRLLRQFIGRDTP